jgi:hypothetical protein
MAKRMKKALPFLIGEREHIYRIKSFHLTERERALFDRAATSPRRSRADLNKLKQLGFNDSEFEAYKQLIRYLPRYVETAV